MMVDHSRASTEAPGPLTGRIVARIAKLIETEQLVTGERLPAERDLARLLGVSRPALREAVKILEAHGRLVVRHGQGVFVGSPPRDTVRDRLVNLEVSLAELYAMREVLEEPAAEWAANNATPEDLDALAATLQAVEEEARAEVVDFVRLGKVDSAFHLQIVEAAKNRFLGQTLEVLQEILASGMETTLTVSDRTGQSCRDHRAIFEAIRRGDPEAARAAVRTHVRGARDAALGHVRVQAGAADRSLVPPRGQRSSSASRGQRTGGSKESGPKRKHPMGAGGVEAREKAG